MLQIHSRYRRKIVKAGTLLSTLIFLFTAFAFAQPTTVKDTPRTEKPYAVEYYYTAKWGYADEFIRLFKKNHYPILKRLMEMGRIVSVTAVRPTFHATEDKRWDYRVTIVWKTWNNLLGAPDEENIKRELFPDQETFVKEEQRRFEILLAHWDVPITDVPLEDK
jgi:hypothetical protein